MVAALTLTALSGSAMPPGRRRAGCRRRATTAGRACPGAASDVLALERANEVVGQRLVEVVADPDRAAERAGHSRAPLVVHRHEPDDRLPVPRDHDFLARDGLVDEAREVRLCCMDVDLPH